MLTLDNSRNLTPEGTDAPATQGPIREYILIFFFLMRITWLRVIYFSVQIPALALPGCVTLALLTKEEGRMEEDVEEEKKMCLVLFANWNQWH